ncbi:DUF1127 domain-containing protein [Roseomonas elaeocarpi]|uniref:DUF1127 domain-containing protein n=1 Tax=Roseomonas elaeocarpi TaxID=907779 RepID=A0ABV6JW46_9PROT
MIGAIRAEGRSNAVVRNPFPAIWLRLCRWHRNVSTRRALLEMADHELRDVGLTRMQARCEAARPFWDDAADESLVVAVRQAAFVGRRP